MRERLLVGVGILGLALGLLTALPAAPAAAAAAKGSFLGDAPSRSKLEVPRLETLDFQAGEKGTDLTVRGSAPFMFTAYESSKDTFVLDLPGVDVGDLGNQEVGTPEVSGVTVRRPEEVQGSSYARIEVQIGPRGGRPKASMDPADAGTVRIHVPRLAGGQPGADTPVAARLQAEARERAVSEFDPASVLQVPAPAPKATPKVTMGREDSAPRPEGPAAATLKDIRVTPAGDALSIELVTDGVVEYSSFELDNPSRLVVDLRGVHETVRSGAILIGTSGVKKVRVAQHQPDPNPVVRVVLDTTRSLAHRVDRKTDGLTVHVSDKGDQAIQAIPQATSANSRSTPQHRSPRARRNRLPDPDELLASAEDLGRDDGTALESGRYEEEFPADGPLYETQGVQDAPEIPGSVPASLSFEARVIGGEEVRYTGRPISLDLRDAPIVDIFRLFHELSGLNIVVDPSVGNKTITIDVNDVPWDQVLDLILKTHGLGKTFEGNVLRIAPSSKLAQEEREQQALRDAIKAAQPLKTVTRTLSYARAEEVEQIIQRILRTGGASTANAISIVDERTNTLIIRDTEEKITEINSLIDALDIPARQVMIEARIVETQKNFQQAFGIQWGFNYVASPEFGNQTDFAFPNRVLLDGNALTGEQGLDNPLDGFAVNLPAPSINSAIGISLANVLNTFQLDIALQALESKGKARVISSPRVIAQNNEEASIESGVQIPIVSTTAAEIDVRFVSASLRLDVTPQITKEDTIIMELTVENNSPSGTVNVGDVPGINTRQATTTVLVQNGGTTVIGGIYQVNESVNTSRTPLLHRIPLLGWLFKNKNTTTDNNELLIFVTPRILN